MEPDVLTRLEALRVLRVGKDFVYTDEARSIPWVRLGRRVVIRREALLEWLRARERAGRGGGPR